MSKHSLIVLFLLITLAISNVYAAGADDSRQFVDNVGKKVLTIVNGSDTEQQKQEQLRQAFSENVDINWMGQFVLGRGWAQASEEQRNRYLQAYKEYLLARYTTNFRDYAGSNYKITGAKPLDDGQFLVGMSIEAPRAEDQQVQAGYRVNTAGGAPKIIDIIIEGVSLITTERSEFASVLQKDGIDKLTQQIQEKTSATTGKSK